MPGIITLFIISFAMSAVFWREPELVVDSSRYLTQAKHLGQYGILHFLVQWGKDIAPWTDLPAGSFLYGLVFRIFGESRVYIQILNSIMFSSTVALTAMLGNELFRDSVDDQIASAGAISLLAIPYLYIQVPLMMVDVTSMFFLTLSVYLFQKTMRTGGVLNIIVTSITVLFALLSKYSIWPMLSVLLIVLIVNLKKGDRKFLLSGGAVLLASGALAAVFMFYYMDVISEQIHLLVTYQKPGLEKWSESFVSTFFFQIHPFITLGALYSVIVAVKRKDAKYLIVSWIWIIMLVLMIKRARYLVPAFPMFALMASYGLMGIGNIRVRKAVVYCAAIVSFVIAAFAYLPALEKTSYTNLKNAGKYINSLPGDNIRVLSLPQDSSINPAVAVPMLDIYTEKRIAYCYDIKPTMTREEINNSSFRFTWTYRNPDYYVGGPDKDRQRCVLKATENTLIAVIHSRKDNVLENNLTNYRLIKRFNEHNEDYNFKTFVDIYEYDNGKE
jgi:hypothetical protein